MNITEKQIASRSWRFNKAEYEKRKKAFLKERGCRDRKDEKIAAVSVEEWKDISLHPKSIEDVIFRMAMKHEFIDAICTSYFLYNNEVPFQVLKEMFYVSSNVFNPDYWTDEVVDFVYDCISKQPMKKCNNNRSIAEGYYNLEPELQLLKCSDNDALREFAKNILKGKNSEMENGKLKSRSWFISEGEFKCVAIDTLDYKAIFFYQKCCPEFIKRLKEAHGGIFSKGI